MPVILDTVTLVPLVDELLRLPGLIELITILVFLLLQVGQELLLHFHFRSLNLVHLTYKLGSVVCIFHSLRCFLLFFPKFEDSCLDLGLLMLGELKVVHGDVHLVDRLNHHST